MKYQHTAQDHCRIKKGRCYFMQADNFSYDTSAEVPITSIYRDELVKKMTCPIKMTAYTPCFRREAGSFGNRWSAAWTGFINLIRWRSFNSCIREKVMMCWKKMVNHVEQIIEYIGTSLSHPEIMWRWYEFCFCTYLWFWSVRAAQERWLEVSSVSHFETFQSNRMKIRFKDNNGTSQLVPSLTGEFIGPAKDRWLVCWNLPNTTDGIKLPGVLHS